MSLFGALVRTAINVVLIPVTLPAAILKDAVDIASGSYDPGFNTKDLVKQIKDEAEPKP